MKFECKDCHFGIFVKDKSLKLCPQCGSDNIEFLLLEVHKREEVERSKEENISLIVFLVGITFLLVPLIAIEVFPLPIAITLFIIGGILIYLTSCFWRLLLCDIIKITKKRDE